MFDLHLRMKPVWNDQLHIAIPAQFRWLFFALAVLTAWVAFETRIWSPVGIGVLVLAICILLYDERWIFDRVSGEVHHRIGLLFFARHIVFSMRDIDHFEFRVMESKGKKLVQLLMWTFAKDAFLIESQAMSSANMLAEEAQFLADFCGKTVDGL
jgi:hypothetical protein